MARALQTMRRTWGGGLGALSLHLLKVHKRSKYVQYQHIAYALCSLAAPCFMTGRVVIPLCGGNIDTTVLGRCLERGLAADGRLCRFVATVSDRAGGIAELTNRIASIGVWSVLVDQFFSVF